MALGPVWVVGPTCFCDFFVLALELLLVAVPPFRSPAPAPVADIVHVLVVIRLNDAENKTHFGVYQWPSFDMLKVIHRKVVIDQQQHAWRP